MAKAKFKKAELPQAVDALGDLKAIEDIVVGLRKDLAKHILKSLGSSEEVTGARYMVSYVGASSPQYLDKDKVERLLGEVKYKRCFLLGHRDPSLRTKALPHVDEMIKTPEEVFDTIKALQKLYGLD
tara:strand:- start:836 stop:1216 length:381 start_codon:yes stop_codon:yes gene_type:complete